MPPRSSSGSPSFGLPKPKGAVAWLLAGMFAFWLMLALADNWGGADTRFVDRWLFGTTHDVLHLQLWRLLTAPLVHVWRGDFSHIITTLLVIYFFGPGLQDRWGDKKFLMFAFGSAAFGFACQMLFGSLIPKLDQPVWYGGLGMADAIVIAWALQAEAGSRILLFFVLPVSPALLIAFTLGLNILHLIVVGKGPEGLVTPFGAMAAAYLFSGRSPLRRYWLQLKLKRIQAQTEALKSARTARVRSASAPALRVIHGEKDAPKDKRFLN